MHQRLEFPVSVALGLAKAMTEDTDVFLIALSAVAPKKASRALLAYVTCRRVDALMSAYFYNQSVQRMQTMPHHAGTTVT